VDVATAVGSTNVVADVVGWYDDGTGAGDLFSAVTPVRMLDTRVAGGPVVAGAPRDLEVRLPGAANGVPATGTAVVANITVTNATDQTFVSMWPSGEQQPNVSNLNSLPGQTLANLAIVKIGANGRIRIANAVGSVNVIVDVVGYFDTTTGSRFRALVPNRIVDTRIDQGLSGPQGPGQTRLLVLAGAAVPDDATGFVANVTVTGATRETFMSVYPGGGVRPNPFSNVNAGLNQAIPNLIAVGIAPDGTVGLYNHLGSAELIVDAVGYYAPL